MPPLSVVDSSLSLLSLLMGLMVSGTAGSVEAQLLHALCPPERFPAAWPVAVDLL